MLGPASPTSVSFFADPARFSMPARVSFSPGAPAPVAAPPDERDADAARRGGVAVGVRGGVEAGAAVEEVGPGVAHEIVVARVAVEVVVARAAGQRVVAGAAREVVGRAVVDGVADHVVAAAAVDGVLVALAVDHVGVRIGAGEGVLAGAAEDGDVRDVDDGAVVGVQEVQGDVDQRDRGRAVGAQHRVGVGAGRAQATGPEGRGRVADDDVRALTGDRRLVDLGRRRAVGDHARRRAGRVGGGDARRLRERRAERHDDPCRQRGCDVRSQRTSPLSVCRTPCRGPEG